MICGLWQDLQNVYTWELIPSTNIRSWNNGRDGMWSIYWNFFDELERLFIYLYWHYYESLILVLVPFLEGRVMMKGCSVTFRIEYVILFFPFIFHMSNLFFFILTETSVYYTSRHIF